MTLRITTQAKPSTWWAQMAGVVVVFAAPSAFAQQPTPTTAPAPAPAATTTTTTTTAPAATAPATETVVPREESTGRFRWGFSGFGGKYFTNGTGAGVGGVEARFGYQINDLIGVYGQPVVLIGGGASAGVNGASASALVLGGVGALADLTFGDIFFIAAGPELLDGAAGSSSASSSSSSSSGSAGTFFSVVARTGVALGSVKPKRRSAFTIGIDFRAIFTPGSPTLVPVLALGYDAF